MDQDNTPRGDDSIMKLDRRQVLKGMGLLGTALAVGDVAGMSRVFAEIEKGEGSKGAGGLPHRPLGRTGAQVPILALGGGHLIKTSDDEGTRIVHEAIEAGLLIPADGRVESYEFVHVIVRQTLAEGWSPSRRIRLHRRAAEALLTAYPDREAELAPELATQFHASTAPRVRCAIKA